MSLIERLKHCPVPDKLGKLWNVEYEMMEEGYLDGFKQMDIDPVQEVLRVFADPSKLKTSMSGEDGTCWRRWTSAFPVGE
jgi:hypothetical protein